MTGVSQFSRVAKRAAAQAPPHLKAIFAPYGWTDMYRDLYYHGGILNYCFMSHWMRGNGPFFRTKNTLREQWGEAKYAQAIAAALRDPEIAAVPYLAETLRNPDTGANSAVADILLNPLWSDYYDQRSVDFTNAKTAAYFGGDWGIYGLHLPGDVRAYEHWKGPKKMTIGPPVYLDRPLYQYAYESLRWFDHWLKGVDTKILEEPAINLFIVGTNEWKLDEEWPLPETRWTPFYLHANGLLSEHEFWLNEGCTTFEDSPFHHGQVVFRTPPLVENTELCGPMVLNLYGSTTDKEVLWFISLLHISLTGEERLLTRGWLRGTQRQLDAAASKPWQPIHSHTQREPLEPGHIYEFNIEIRPYGILLQAGERLALRIKCADDDVPRDNLEVVGVGHVSRRNASHVAIHHNADNPSCLLLPITKGNRIGTFISGGKLPPLPKS
jgi:predicted acyl esterase